MPKGNDDHEIKRSMAGALDVITQPAYDGKSNRSNICMECEKACGGVGDRGCEWSRGFKPVPGWDAEMVFLKQSPGVSVVTYHIKKCPKFVRTPERPGAKGGIMSENESYEFLKDPIEYLRRHDHGVNLEKLAKQQAERSQLPPGHIFAQASSSLFVQSKPEVM